MCGLRKKSVASAHSFRSSPPLLASLTYFVPDSNCRHSRAKDHDRGCAVKEKDHFP
jgi:hypothetical protein